MDMTPKPQETKAKIKQMGLHQTLKTSAQHKIQSEKAIYGMGENICKPYIWQGVNIQNIERISTAQQHKNQ